MRRCRFAGRRAARYTHSMSHTVDFDPAAPLDRCAGESRAAHDALLDYWRAGSGRSLRALLERYRNQTDSEAGANEPPTRRFATLFAWSGNYRWQERIDAASVLQQRAEEQAKRDALRAEAEKWARRQLEVRERDWQQADRLRGLADQIMDEAPKFLRVTQKLIRGKDGEPDTILKTVALDAGLAVRAMELSSKLQRLSAEMETDHTLTDTVQAETVDDIRKRRWEQIADALGAALATEADGGADA